MCGSGPVFNIEQSVHEDIAQSLVCMCGSGPVFNIEQSVHEDIAKKKEKIYFFYVRLLKVIPIREIIL
jgi:NADH:ubiquinone oxidoreductase subunit E